MLTGSQIPLPSFKTFLRLTQHTFPILFNLLLPSSQTGKLIVQRSQQIGPFFMALFKLLPHLEYSLLSPSIRILLQM